MPDLKELSVQIEKVMRTQGNRIKNMTCATIHNKEGHFNLYTDMDVSVQEELRKALTEVLPECSFFAEEQENG